MGHALLRKRSGWSHPSPTSELYLPDSDWFGRGRRTPSYLHCPTAGRLGLLTWTWNIPSRHQAAEHPHQEVSSSSRGFTLLNARSPTLAAPPPRTRSYTTGPDRSLTSPAYIRGTLSTLGPALWLARKCCALHLPLLGHPSSRGQPAKIYANGYPEIQTRSIRVAEPC